MFLSLIEMEIKTYFHLWIFCFYNSMLCSTHSRRKREYVILYDLFQCEVKFNLKIKFIYKWLHKNRKLNIIFTWKIKSQNSDNLI